MACSHPDPVTTPQTPSSVTELLHDARRGRPGAADELARLVYAELHTLAASYLRRERADNTLQPTALVHEAFLRLMAQERVDWRNRAHFFGIAAQLMRRILVDHARRHQAAKRDAGLAVTLDDDVAGGSGTALEVLRVHEALETLAQLDPRQARLVELRFFVGLTLEETAEVLGVSRATVTREWTLARAWLHEELREG